MVEKVLKIFFTVCKSELLGIVYSSHCIEENASAYSGNGHNRASLCKKTKNQSKNSYLYPKLVQTRSNLSKVVTC